MPTALELPQGFTIRSTLLPHGGINTLGLVFEEKSSGKRFAYYNDCKRIPREAVAFARGADVVVLGGLRPEPHPSHMNIAEACAAAAEIGGKSTYLTHLTHRSGTYRMEWRRNCLFPGCSWPYDGLRLLI